MRGAVAPLAPVGRCPQSPVPCVRALKERPSSLLQILSAPGGSWVGVLPDTQLLKPPWALPPRPVRENRGVGRLQSFPVQAGLWVGSDPPSAWQFVFS